MLEKKTSAGNRSGSNFLDGARKKDNNKDYNDSKDDEEKETAIQRKISRPKRGMTPKHL
jgi:hypothetical protein